jgi:UTP--glucose-1-phosphate uridylyltransferase
MLPIVDKPTLLYVVEEAVAAGIEDIIIIAGRGKSAIENFFDTSYEVEDLLGKQGRWELVEDLKRISNMANIISIRQKEAKGLGHAVYCSQPIVGKDPFCVLLGDEITQPIQNFSYVSKELVDIFDQDRCPVVSLMQVPENQTHKYGIVKVQSLSKKHKNCELFQITDVVEKPDPGKAPSQLALPGRYVFTSEIFEYLQNAVPGKNGEIQLTDAMVKLAKNSGLRGIAIPNRRYDAGDKLGYLFANIEMSLTRPELAAGLIEHLKSLHSRNYEL